VQILVLSATSPSHIYSLSSDVELDDLLQIL
jgi:hypothetical protein